MIIQFSNFVTPPPRVSGSAPEEGSVLLKRVVQSVVSSLKWNIIVDYIVIMFLVVS